MKNNQTPIDEAAKFFNDINKDELSNYIALKAIFHSHELDTKEVEEAFVAYAKKINDLKVTVLKQLEQTGLVDDTLAKLNFKVKENE